jgi:uncharacterized membrane protein
MKYYSKLRWAIVVLASIGALYSGYLAYARLIDSSITCGIVEGCNVVASSPYSELFGVIPLSYLGFIFYVDILLLGILLFKNDRPSLYFTLLAFTSAGFLSSLYFIYLQAAVIKAYCIYCLMSAGTSTILFIVAILIFCIRRNINKPDYDTDT